MTSLPPTPLFGSGGMAGELAEQRAQIFDYRRRAVEKEVAAPLRLPDAHVIAIRIELPPLQHSVFAQLLRFDDEVVALGMHHDTHAVYEAYPQGLVHGGFLVLGRSSVNRGSQKCASIRASESRLP